MSNGLERQLEVNGVALSTIPNLEPQPKKKYYSKDRETGEIHEHILPADPYSLRHYLRKGFKLNKSELQGLKTPAQ